MLFLTNNDGTDTDSSNQNHDNDVDMEIHVLLMMSYGIIFLAFVDGVIVPRKVKGLPIVGKFLLKPLSIVKLCLRSCIPAHLVFIYTTLLFMVLNDYHDYHHRATGNHDRDRSSSNEDIMAWWQLTSFVVSWIGFTLVALFKQRMWRGYVSGSNSKSNAFGQMNMNGNIGTVSNSISKPNERGWEHWNNSQCIQWTTYNYLDRYNDANMKTNTRVDDDTISIIQEEFQCLINAFESERINGQSIPYLSLEHLRSMGISFGVAIEVLKGIQDLMVKFPKQSRELHIDLMESQNHQYQYHYPNHTNNRKHGHNGQHASKSNSNSSVRTDSNAIDLDAWLGKTSSTSSSTTIPVKKISMGEMNAAMQMPTSDGGDFSMSEVKDLMKDRFGLDVPEPDFATHNNMHPHSDAHANVNTHHAALPEYQHPQVDDIATPTSAGLDSGLNSTPPGLSEEFLKSMPPNVRDIAKRRPDLVKSLMQQTPSSSNNRDTGLRLDSNGGSTSNESLVVIDEEIGDWQEDNHEMVGLLRRRRSNAA